MELVKTGLFRMKNTDKLIAKGLYELRLFECRFKDGYCAIIAPTVVNSILEDLEHSGETDYEVFLDFVEKYKNILPITFGETTPVALKNIDNIAEKLLNDDKLFKKADTVYSRVVDNGADEDAIRKMLK